MRTPTQQSGTGLAVALAGLAPVAMACDLEAFRRNGSLGRDGTMQQADRGAPGWRKWCCATSKCFPMRSSATVPISTRCGLALVSSAKHVHLILHMCTAQYSTTSTAVVQGWCKMIISLRSQAETRTVGPVDGLDQPSIAGPCAAPSGCGIDLDELYPTRCDAVSPVEGHCCARA